MPEFGKQVVSYHPKIFVKGGPETLTIEAVFDDFYEPREIITKLAVGYPKCKTVGELAETIFLKPSSRIIPGVISCCIRKNERGEEASDIVCYYSDPI